MENMFSNIETHRMGGLVAVVLPGSKRIRILADCGGQSMGAPLMELVASYELDDTTPETVNKLLRDFLNAQIKTAPIYRVDDRRGGFPRPASQ